MATKKKAKEIKEWRGFGGKEYREVGLIAYSKRDAEREARRQKKMGRFARVVPFGRKWLVYMRPKEGFRVHGVQHFPKSRKSGRR